MNLGQKGIRGGTRIPVELPVQIRWKSPEGIERFAKGKTGSMSGNGLFIAAPLRLRHDMPITFTVTLPADVTNIPVQLRCVGRVVRQHRTGTPAGLGVVIDDYRFSAVKQLA
jgi:PilZ domain